MNIDFVGLLIVAVVTLAFVAIAMIIAEIVDRRRRRRLHEKSRNCFSDGVFFKRWNKDKAPGRYVCKTCCEDLLY